MQIRVPIRCSKTAAALALALGVLVVAAYGGGEARGYTNAQLRRDLAEAEALVRRDSTFYEIGKAQEIHGKWSGLRWSTPPEIDPELRQRLLLASSRCAYHIGEFRTALTNLRAAGLPTDPKEAAQVRKDRAELARLVKLLQEAHAAYEAGNKDQAIARVKRVIELFPDVPYPLGYLGRLYYETGRTADYAELQRQVAASFKGTNWGASGLLALTGYHLEQGQPEKALAACSDLLGQYGDRHERACSYLLRAECYAALGKTADALSDLKRARRAFEYLPEGARRSFEKKIADLEAKARAPK